MYAAPTKDVPYAVGAAYIPPPTSVGIRICRPAPYPTACNVIRSLVSERCEKVVSQDLEPPSFEPGVGEIIDR